jgi:hypothetical protein
MSTGVYSTVALALITVEVIEAARPEAIAFFLYLSDTDCFTEDTPEVDS